LTLTSSLETSPWRVTPKVVSFKGVVKLPQTIHLISGHGKVGQGAAEIIFDNQIVCSYSPQTNVILLNKVYKLISCSDGSRANDNMHVMSKIEVKLNNAQSKATLQA